MGRLDGKVALVTGGSRGIGRAIVERFAAEGAQVVTCSRKAPQSDFEEKNIAWTAADVAETGDVEALIAFATGRHGRIDLLVNNAGIEIEKRVDETSDADWEDLMGANLKSVFLCCRAVIPVMRAQGGGAIVNLGSVSGLAADPNMALYNSSKAAVHGLTRSIAVDHGRDGIRCNAICPGWIETEMLQQTFAQAGDVAAARAAAVARHPVGRLGRPEDIAALALWLASDEAGFATGQLYVLDGGLTAASPFDPAAFH